MNTHKLHEEILKRVPQWLLIAIVILATLWFGGLSYVAFFTNRSVEFFPPKIGSDPQLLAEFQLLTTAINNLSKERLEQITFLRKELAKERENVASARSFMSLGYFDHKDNVDKYEKEVNEAERQYSKDLSYLKTSMENLERKLK